MAATPYHFDFEQPIAELERKLQELQQLDTDHVGVDLAKELKTIEGKLARLKRDTYGNLTPWQRVQIARHPQRPFTLDYIEMLTQDFLELHGDRHVSDDKALIGGFAKFAGDPVLVLGHQKGRDTKENLWRNFGSAHPEGYRKALRLMELAAKRHRPIIVFVDTPGAYPGVAAEERGQAYWIAHNLREMMRIESPILVIVIGEGGSGGALGIGIGDQVCMLENAYYSVISPEGCAAILWKDRQRAPDAAAALKITGEELLKRGFVDGIIPEPLGGAHHDPHKAAEGVRQAIATFIHSTKKIPMKTLLNARYDRFRCMGVFNEGPDACAPTRKRRTRTVSTTKKPALKRRKKTTA
jgi:acetyl-CoA carboxylase carboxyl transferase subunit alpha